MFSGAHWAWAWVPLPAPAPMASIAFVAHQIKSDKMRPNPMLFRGADCGGLVKVVAALIPPLGHQFSVVRTWCVRWCRYPLHHQWHWPCLGMGVGAVARSSTNGIGAGAGNGGQRHPRAAPLHHRSTTNGPLTRVHSANRTRLNTRSQSLVLPRVAIGN